MRDAATDWRRGLASGWPTWGTRPALPGILTFRRRALPGAPAVPDGVRDAKGGSAFSGSAAVSIGASGSNFPPFSPESASGLSGMAAMSLFPFHRTSKPPTGGKGSPFVGRNVPQEDKHANV